MADQLKRQAADPANGMTLSELEAFCASMRVLELSADTPVGAKVKGLNSRVVEIRTIERRIGE